VPNPFATERRGRLKKKGKKMLLKLFIPDVFIKKRTKKKKKSSVSPIFPKRQKVIVFDRDLFGPCQRYTDCGAMPSVVRSNGGRCR